MQGRPCVCTDHPSLVWVVGYRVRVLVCGPITLGWSGFVNERLMDLETLERRQLGSNGDSYS